MSLRNPNWIYHCCLNKGAIKKCVQKSWLPDFLGGSMGGRGRFGRGQRRVSPPSLGLARYSGLPGQGQEETLADWFLERAAHTLHLSLPQIGTHVPASWVSEPICKPLRNKLCDLAGAESRSAASGCDQKFVALRAVAGGSTGRSRGSLSCCQGHTSPTLGFPPNWGWGDLAPRQVTQFPAPTTYTV